MRDTQLLRSREVLQLTPISRSTFEAKHPLSLREGSRDLVERRRTLMDPWAAYRNAEGGHIVPMVHRHG